MSSEKLCGSAAHNRAEGVATSTIIRISVLQDRFEAPMRAIDFWTLCGSRTSVLTQVKFEPVFSEATACETSRGQQSAGLALGLECLQICHDIRDLMGLEPELRHRRMVGDNALGQPEA